MCYIHIDEHVAFHLKLVQPFVFQENEIRSWVSLNFDHDILAPVIKFCESECGDYQLLKR